MNKSDLPRFLLVTSEEDSLWKDAVTKALETIGELDITNKLDDVDLLCVAHYDLVIIDSLVVKDVQGAIRRIRTAREGVRVVVAAHSPTWRRARDVFRAGAVDYIRKSLNPERIRETLLAAQVKSQPPFQANKQSRR